MHSAPSIQSYHTVIGLDETSFGPVWDSFEEENRLTYFLLQRITAHSFDPLCLCGSEALKL